MAEALAEASIAPNLNGEARSMSHGVNLDHRGHARTILGAGVSQQLDLANVPDVYHAQFEVTVHASVVYVVDRSAATENRNGTSIVDDAWNFSQQVGERALLGQHRSCDGRSQHTLAAADVRASSRYCNFI